MSCHNLLKSEVGGVEESEERETSQGERMCHDTRKTCHEGPKRVMTQNDKNFITEDVTCHDTKKMLHLWDEPTHLISMDYDMSQEKFLN